MAPTRHPRDDETAPGSAPGAESFPTSAGNSAPQGIVRLSDLFSPEDFADAGPSSGSEKSKGRGRRGSQASRKPVARRVGALDSTARSAHAADAGRPAVAAAPAQAEGARSEPGAASDPAHPLDDGPAYESLFGNAGDTRRPAKRERKPATALQRALGLLTRREHSRKELTRKLVSRGVDAAEVEAAVDKLAGAGWQDDARFAESLVRSRASTGYGPLHIRAELGTHDLPAEVRQAALDDFEGDWVEIARDLVARRFARIDDPQLRQRKASDFLIRRGFPGDVVRAAVRTGDED